jgi:hypothetical protein
MMSSVNDSLVPTHAVDRGTGAIPAQVAPNKGHDGMGLPNLSPEVARLIGIPPSNIANVLAKMRRMDG